MERTKFFYTENGKDRQIIRNKMVKVGTNAQIKTIMRYHFTPVRMAAIQKSTSNKCWRGWRKGNPLTLLVGMQTSTATMENNVEIP